MNNRVILTAALTSVLLSGCSLTGKFTTPNTDTPASYKEEGAAGPAAEQGVWVPAKRMDKSDRGAWWAVFNDAKLDDLEKQAAAENQDLKAAAARVAEARDFARSEIPSVLPDLSIGANAAHSQPASASLSAFGTNTNGTLRPYTLYDVGGTASYEVDLFGKVRSNYRALLRDADAQESAYRSVLLSLQADVAQNYFALRALDSERRLLRDTVDSRDRANNMMKRRFDQGDARTQDYEQTRADLASAKADLADLDRRRSVNEHALAVLLGVIPSSFTFAEAPLTEAPPAIPAGLPSTLLERRPDIAGAVSTMAAANERIGVARAAFYPSLDLSASGGFESTSLGDLFTWPMRTWALGQLAGSALNLTIFDNGRRDATLKQAHAVYDEAVATYRQQVLVAFRDVEDNLSGQRHLADQSVAADEAAQTSTHATELTRKRFDDGDADYFEVVESQRISLAAERAAVQIRGQRFITTVTLIRALGGGWDEDATVAAPAPEAAPTTAAAPVQQPAPQALTPAPETAPKVEPATPAPATAPKTAPEAVAPAPAAEEAPPVEKPAAQGAPAADDLLSAPATPVSAPVVSSPVDDDPQTPVFPPSTSGAVSHPEK